ncbi:MAG: SBBP repeat-containing protein [Capsulimonas sp.]|uniref:DUF7948 domain-containing protein n=1 Tax=Capsulimonas sp. TaxID=2494211 RepID=UPI00326387A0
MGATGAIAEAAHGLAITPQAYGSLPISFEANRGQAHTNVNFLARGGNYGLQLSSQGAVFTLSSPEKRAPLASVLTMRLDHANPNAKSAGEQELPGKVNCFIGKDPSQWRTDIPTYARVRYTDVYPGTDLVYYGNQRQMEYDFVLAPHADPKAIRFAVTGSRKISVNRSGDLVIALGDQQIVWRKPVIYQGAGVSRRAINGAYKLMPGNRVAFSVGAYDHNRALVIDPVLAYSTYLGLFYQDNGNRNPIAVNGAGEVYITGTTIPPQGPTPPNSSVNLTAYQNIFVTKLNATGTGALYTNYFGGSIWDFAADIKVDSGGNAYVTGTTQSTDFPVTSAAFCKTPGTSTTGFVFKLNPAGNQLLYSTYLGSANASANAIAIDAAGNAYVTGSASGSYPVTAGAFQTAPASASFDAFLTVLNASGGNLIYSSLIGGGENDFGTGVAVSQDGLVFLCGSSDNFNADSHFPTTVSAFQKQHLGSKSAFVCKFDVRKSGTASLLYSSLLGVAPYHSATVNTLGMTDAYAIAVNSAGNAYVVGSSDTTLPTTATAYRPTAFTVNAYLAKFSFDGSALLYSTYLNGEYSSQGLGVALAGDDVACIAGMTSSPTFPVTADAAQLNYGGGYTDGFFTKIDTPKLGKSGLLYSTYFGGSGDDRFTSVALDAKLDAYVCGSTNGVVTTTAGGYHPNHPATPQSNWDEVAVKLSVGNIRGQATITSLSPSRIDPGSAHTLIYFTGYHFVTGAVVTINDLYTVSANVMSDTLLSAYLPDAVTASAGQYYVRVVNPGVNLYSAPVRLTVARAMPVISSVTPDRIGAGLASLSLYIYGTGFTAGSKVTFNGGFSATPTSIQTNRLIVSIPAAILAQNGSYAIRVVNSFADGGASEPKSFVVSPRPVLTAITPSTFKAGAASVTLTLTGANFEAGSLVKINDTTSVTTTFVSSTKLTIVLPSAVSSTAGSHFARVFNPGYSNNSVPARFTVTPK